ncbi:MAG: 3D domain-containing protein [Firmicutes bacterium]|nr:3D domain-containing protein [Bacillota bacterium]
MHRTEKQKMRRRNWLHRLLAIAVMAAALAGLLSQAVFAQNNYVITDGDHVTVHKSYSTDPDVVLDEAGIELSEEDTYTTTYNDGVGRIDIQRMQMVTVIHRGERSVIGTYGETVSALLGRLNITLGANDLLSCERDSLTYDGMIVEIVHKEIEIEEYDETIPYQTNYFEDPELAAGEELVLIEGVDGVVHYKTQIVYENGKEVSREIIDETVVTEMVTRLVVKGPERVITEQPDEPDHRVPETIGVIPEKDSDPVKTGATEGIANGTITTASGTTYTYTDVLTVTATAYSCEGYTGYTYSGTVARVGAIAVDPNYIPLGTKMYIVSNDGQYVYGYCTAEDTGGGIKGYKVDLYFDTIDECWEFGVRTCTVYILA